PVVIEFGSFTCAHCTNQLDAMDALAEKYQGTVKFLVVYGHETHPEEADTAGHYRADDIPIAEAWTYAERLAYARDFRTLRHVKRQILVDEFGEKSASWKLLNTTAYTHPLVVLDVEGRPALRSAWGEAQELDVFLTKLLASSGRYTPPLPVDPK